MAIWQFKFSLVLKERVIDLHGEVPDIIEEFKYFDTSTSLEEMLVENSSSNYWQGFNLCSLKDQIEKIIPLVETYDNTEFVFRDNKGNCISLYEDGFFVEVDARDFRESYIRKIIMLGSELNCLAVITGSGKVVNCNFEEIMGEYRVSRAVAFVKDPNLIFEENF